MLKPYKKGKSQGAFKENAGIIVKQTAVLYFRLLQGVVASG